VDQQGKIIELIDETRVKIAVKKHASCENCGKCHIGNNNDTVTIIARNNIHAQLGDLVEVSMETRNILNAAAIMYIFPLSFLILGIFIGNLIFQGSKKDVLSIILGFMFLAISYLIIRTKEKTFSKKYESIITKII